jgi:hypothetical protein
MYHSGLLLQIVEPKHGTVITFPAGEKAEADLIRICTEEIVKLGVGLFRTEAHVEVDIRAGIFNAIQIFKAHTAGR